MPKKTRRGKDVLTYEELFGKRVRIINSLDPGLRDLEGVFWDETASTIVLKTPRGLVRVYKKNIVMRIIGYGGPITYNQIKGRPYERVKVKRKR